MLQTVGVCLWQNSGCVVAKSGLTEDSIFVEVNEEGSCDRSRPYFSFSSKVEDEVITTDTFFSINDAQVPAQLTDTLMAGSKRVEREDFSKTNPPRRFPESGALCEKSS